MFELFVPVGFPQCFCLFLSGGVVKTPKVRSIRIPRKSENPTCRGKKSESLDPGKESKNPYRKPLENS